MLRLEALAAKKLMSPEQTAMLRTLAWSKDFSLLKSYEQVGSCGGLHDGGCSSLSSANLKLPHATNHTSDSSNLMARLSTRVQILTFSQIL
jgi:hypothetical protein